MAFACIYIADFLVQAVVRAEPALQDCAIALISGTPPLWNVVAANPAACQAGIQTGMMRAEAEQFHAVQVRHRSEAQEKAAHGALLDVGWSVSPRVEDTALDTVVLDLDGLEGLLGAAENIAKTLYERVCSIGLTPHIAIAGNIDAAIHAARGFTGITIIPAGEECQRLSSLPVQVLATTSEVMEILERWGVHGLQALAALPVLQLSERLGQEGVRLHQLARGGRKRSLVLAEAQVHFAEELELDDAVEELEPLSFLLGRLLDQLCARLQARSLAVRAVHVQFDLKPSFEKDFQVLDDESRNKTAAKRYSKVLSLPVPMKDSKVLLKLLRLQLQGDAPAAPIHKIVLVAEPAADRVVQGGLFVPAAPDPEKLELTMARLAKLVGDANIGAAELVDSHGAENFRMTRFLASPGEPYKKIATKQEIAPQEQEARKPMMGLRLCKPSFPVRVTLQEEQPARILLSGRTGRVVAASGPWRSSGTWWQEDAWNEEEWDLTIDFDAVDEQCEKNWGPWPQYGVYRIYYDVFRGSWFVRGLYD